MLVRFLGPRATCVPGGPQYHPGDMAELRDDLAERFIGLGWCEAVRAYPAPPANRMMGAAPAKKRA